MFKANQPKRTKFRNLIFPKSTKSQTKTQISLLSAGRAQRAGPLSRGLSRKRFQTASRIEWRFGDLSPWGVPSGGEKGHLAGGPSLLKTTGENGKDSFHLLFCPLENRNMSSRDGSPLKPTSENNKYSSAGSICLYIFR